MVDGTPIARTADVPARGSYLFTVEDAYADEREVILVRCEEAPGVRGWINECPHENQRFDRGSGAPMRNDEIVCPKHGSMFDACSGDCRNGEAAGTTLPAVEVAVEDDRILLTDESYTYLHEGGIDESDGDDDGPGSTSHLSF